MLRSVGLEHRARRIVAARQQRRGPSADAERSWEKAVWSDVKQEIQLATSGTGTVLAGPWMSEVGFEVLYWIPFLRWVVERFEIDPERLTAVSRGGVASWYEGIAGGYVDIFDMLSVQEFREETEARWSSAGGQKQMEFGKWDRRILRRAPSGLRWNQHAILHPSLMYRLFHRFWRGSASMHHVLSHMSLAPFPAIPDDAWSARLPDEPYTAVKFYFRPSFPDTPANRTLVTHTVERLARERPVLMLNTGLEVDDHLDVDPEVKDERVSFVLDGVPPAANLHVQALSISRAHSFAGTYGGLSYLAPSYGVPSIAYYSNPEHFLPAHLELARRSARACGGSLTAVDARRRDLLRSLEGPA